jgi:hypothetical protein
MCNVGRIYPSPSRSQPPQTSPRHNPSSSIIHHSTQKAKSRPPSPREAQTSLTSNVHEPNRASQVEKPKSTPHPRTLKGLKGFPTPNISVSTTPPPAMTLCIRQYIPPNPMRSTSDHPPLALSPSPSPPRGLTTHLRDTLPNTCSQYPPIYLCLSPRTTSQIILFSSTRGMP